MSAILNRLKGAGNSVIPSTIDAICNMGRAAMNVVMPDNIEYYLCTLELLNVNNEQQGFLSFSVMPENIVESRTPIQTMMKTHKGIVTVFNNSFSPIDISIAGTFGRKFRIVAKCKDPIDITTAKSGFFGLNAGRVLNTVGTWLSSNMSVKSGYGLTKVLEHMLTYANKTDINGQPYFLVFRNYAFNTAYVVNVQNFSFSQSVGNNMIWQYQMNLQAVADANEFALTSRSKDMKNFLTTVGYNSVANGLTKLTTEMIGL